MIHLITINLIAFDKHQSNAFLAYFKFRILLQFLTLNQIIWFRKDRYYLKQKLQQMFFKRFINIGFNEVILKLFFLNFTNISKKNFKKNRKIYLVNSRIHSIEICYKNRKCETTSRRRGTINLYIWKLQILFKFAIISRNTCLKYADIKNCETTFLFYFIHISSFR